MLNADHVVFAESVRLSLVSELNRTRIKFRQAPLYLSITFSVPDRRRRDASNLVDAISDAVSRAIGVDDQWFDGGWRTRLVPEKGCNPTVEVKVWQKTRA